MLCCESTGHISAVGITPVRVPEMAQAPYYQELIKGRVLTGAGNV